MAAMDLQTARKVLGIPFGADEQTVKDAYRRLVRKHHPDVGGDKEQFVRIQEAYDLLSAGPARDRGRASSARPSDPETESRYQDLLREAEDLIHRQREAHRQSQETLRDVRAQSGAEEDSLSSLFRDTVAQVEGGLKKLLDDESPLDAAKTAGKGLKERLAARLSDLNQPPPADAATSPATDHELDPDADLSPAARELARVRRQIIDYARRQSDGPDVSG